MDMAGKFIKYLIIEAHRATIVKPTPPLCDHHKALSCRDER